jgi:hypothetical protein
MTLAKHTLSSAVIGACGILPCLVGAAISPIMIRAFGLVGWLHTQAVGHAKVSNCATRRVSSILDGRYVTRNVGSRSIRVERPVVGIACGGHFCGGAMFKYATGGRRFGERRIPWQAGLNILVGSLRVRVRLQLTRSRHGGAPSFMARF